MLNNDELRRRDALCQTATVSNLIADELLLSLKAVGEDRLIQLAHAALETCETLRMALADDSRATLRRLIKQHSFMKGEFTLSSGRTSGYFFNLKPTMLNPHGSALIAELVLHKLQSFPNTEAIGGLAIGAVPIISVVCAKSYEIGRPISAFYVRKATKDHGTERLIEGFDVTHKLVALVEDVSTTGDSIKEAARAVRSAGGEVAHAITLVDRLEGATENLRQVEITLHPIFTRDEFVT
jgi:orotate phosphoribosyltransferase